MLRKLLTTTAAAALTVSSLSFATVATLAFSTEMAIAGNGNGNNGNGNGNGGNNGRANNGGGNGHGQIASALGGLNAAHANQNALDNAAPNSRVGMIATYQREALLTNQLTATAASALAALNTLNVPTRTSAAIQADIDAAILAGLSTTALAAELADTIAYETAAATYATATAAATQQSTVEADALEAAANKDVPTGDALDALRLMLGLN